MRHPPGGNIPTGGTTYVANGGVNTIYGEAFNMVPTKNTLASVAGKAVSEVAEAVTGVKLIFDAGAYLVAEYSCAKNN
jgi:hypothetical protein